MNRFIKSFYHACAGIGLVFRNELSFRVQSSCAITVLLLIALFPLAAWQTVILILLCALVLTLEILNTIIERVVDMVQPRLHESVRTIKDMMAGAVLLSSVGSVIIGLIIIVPYLVEGRLRF